MAGHALFVALVVLGVAVGDRLGEGLPLGVDAVGCSGNAERERERKPAQQPGPPSRRSP